MIFEGKLAGDVNTKNVSVVIYFNRRIIHKENRFLSGVTQSHNLGFH